MVPESDEKLCLYNKQGFDCRNPEINQAAREELICELQS